MLYLGEVNDKQESAWRKTLEVFDEDRQSSTNLSLFPEDRELPADAIDTLQVKVSALELRRPEHSATAGWPAMFGGNWSWTSSGKNDYRMGAKQ